MCVKKMIKKDRCTYLNNCSFEGVDCNNCAFDHSCPYDEVEENDEQISHRPGKGTGDLCLKKQENILKSQ